MKNIMQVIFGALLALAIIPADAFALRVYSPNVTPEETAIGFWIESAGEGGGGKKPESRRVQLEMRHTFINNRLELGAVAVAESGAGGNAGEGVGYSRLKMRAVMQVTETKAYFADFGVYMDYQIMSSSIRSSIPDYLNILLLFEKDFATWRLSFNPGIRKNMSQAAEAPDNVAQYQMEAKYHMDPAFNPGIQAYGVNMGEWNAVGNQLQYAGPAFDGTLPLDGYAIHYEGAALFGLSPSSYTVFVNGALEIRF